MPRMLISRKATSTGLFSAHSSAAEQVVNSVTEEISGDAETAAVSAASMGRSSSTVMAIMDVHLFPSEW